MRILYIHLAGNNSGAAFGICGHDFQLTLALRQIHYGGKITVTFNINRFSVDLNLIARIGCSINS